MVSAREFVSLSVGKIKRKHHTLTVTCKGVQGHRIEANLFSPGFGRSAIAGRDIYSSHSLAEPRRAWPGAARRNARPWLRWHCQALPGWGPARLALPAGPPPA